MWSFTPLKFIKLYYIDSVSGTFNLVKKQKRFIKDIPIKSSNPFLDHFKDITMEDNNTEQIELIREWWNIVDSRKRTKMWLNKIFDFMIYKYNNELFYKYSINMAMIFTAANYKAWVHDDVGNPENWFPRKRGKLSNALFGGVF